MSNALLFISKHVADHDMVACMAESACANAYSPNTQQTNQLAPECLDEK